MKMNLMSNQQLHTTELLSHHDVVFRAPVCDPTYGLPLGDGSMGNLLWLSEDTLHIQINSTDLIDDIREGEEYNPVFDEAMTICRNGGQLNLQFPCPIFETIYQKQFEARLALTDAVASIHAETVFGRTEIRAFSSSANHVTVLTLSADLAEAMEITSQLSRWGSRTLTHAHAVYHNDPSIGLSDTVSSVEDGCMCITQKMHGASFCIAVKPVSGELTSMRRKHSHTAESVFTVDTHTTQDYYITIAVGVTPEAAKETALLRIQNAVKQGRDALYQRHAQDWADFWNRSYISLPEHQDFLENVWYLNLYYSNCQMRGEYPNLPWNGIWGFYHDYSPWSNVLHWNNQSGTFPLDAANHSDLSRTYFRFCRSMLPRAERYARNVKKKNGAFFVDLCDLKGRMDMTPHYLCIDNCSVGAHIAMEMYQYYRYTGDEAFLADSVLPVMRGAAAYYLDELVLGDDGYYHIYGTSGYENPMLIQDDTSTDLAAIRSLFAALITLVPEEEAAPYKDRLEHLVPFHTADFCEEEIDENGIILLGQGRGRKALADKVMAVGTNPRLPKEQTPETVDPSVLKECGKAKSRLTYGDPKRRYYAQGDQEMFPIFPSGLVGVRDKGTELYNQLANTIYLHPETDIGWCRMPLFLARMGMEDLLEEKLSRDLSERFIFPQGIATDFPCADHPNWFTSRWGRNTIYEQVVVNGLREPLVNASTSPCWNFRHFNFEVAPLVSAAVNEMLLQSYDGVIRLFPTIRTESQAAFRLAAIDGHMVDAVFKNGECDVIISCRRGGTLQLAVDHVNSPLILSDADTGHLLDLAEHDGIYSLETTPGQRIAVKTKNAAALSIEKDYSRNMDVKHHGNAKLGTEKEF